MSFSSTNMCDGEGVSRYMSVSVTLPRNNQSILMGVGRGRIGVYRSLEPVFFLFGMDIDKWYQGVKLLQKVILNFQSMVFCFREEDTTCAGMVVRQKMVIN